MITYYRYQDEDGRTLYTVARHHPKSFELLDAADRPLDEWPDSLVLYRLPELVAAEEDALIYICEGEKDVDRLADLGQTATTNPGGCRQGWCDSYSHYFEDRLAVILADADRPGARHAELVWAALSGICRRVSILKLPRLKRAEDVSDWLDIRGGTPEELFKLAYGLMVKSRRPPPKSRANFNGNYPYGVAAKGEYPAQSKNVGSYQPNGYGVFDMHGNVGKWCSDWYHADYYETSPMTDPQGPSVGLDRVVRGGGWHSHG